MHNVTVVRGQHSYSRVLLGLLLLLLSPSCCSPNQIPAIGLKPSRCCCCLCSPGTFEQLCQDPEAASWMLDQLKVQANADKLKGFEVVKKLLLDPEPFNVENELLTPRFKFKRPQLQKKYQADIDAVYKALND